MLERGVRRRQRPAVAIRAQPHVDAKHEAIGGPLADRRDDTPADTIEELAAGEGARTVGLAILGVDEDEVDVRRDIQLAAAQLAHPDHDQILAGAVGADRLAMRGGERRVVVGEGGPQRDLGQPRHRRAHFPQAGLSGQVAGGRVHQHAAAQRPQRRGERGGVAIGDPRREVGFRIGPDERLG